MRQVAVFARWPTAGQVKTRLHSVLGPDLARRLYSGMLEDALATAAGAKAARAFVYWADRLANAEPFAVPAGVTACEQRGSNLGARLEAAFDELLQEPGDRAVVIGADCPELSGKEIDQAFAELERCDLALAPAFDGGYSLIGLSRRAPELFRHVSWSTESVLSETLERSEQIGLRTTLLSRTRDLDLPADLLAFLAQAIVDDGRSPRTRAALHEMKLLP